MGQYQIGTIIIANGSNVLTGIGTLWLDNVKIGDSFMVNGINVYNQVALVVSDTQILLSRPWSEASILGSGSPGGDEDFAFVSDDDFAFVSDDDFVFKGGGVDEGGENYKIARDFTQNYSLPEMGFGDREWPYRITQAFRLIDIRIKILSDRLDTKAPFTTTTTSTSSTTSSTSSTASTASSTSSTSSTTSSVSSTTISTTSSTSSTASTTSSTSSTSSTTTSTTSTSSTTTTTAPPVAAWYYYGSLGDADFDTETPIVTTYSLGVQIALPAGTVTKMAAKIDDNGTVNNFKFCLKDVDGTNLATGIVASRGSAGVYWIECEIDYVVSADNYVVMYHVETDSVSDKLRHTTGSGVYITESYITCCSDTLPSASPNNVYGIRAWVVP